MCRDETIMSLLTGLGKSFLRFDCNSAEHNRNETSLTDRQTEGQPFRLDCDVDTIKLNAAGGLRGAVANETAS